MSDPSADSPPFRTAPPANDPNQTARALKRLASRGAIYTLGMLLSRAFSILLIPLYTRLLSPADYGLLELVDTADLVVITIFAAAVTDSVLRFFNDAKSPAERAAVVGTATLSLASVGLAVSIVGALFASRLSAALLGSEHYARMLQFTFLAVTSQAVLEVPMAVARGADRPVLWVFAMLSRYVFGLALNVFFLTRMHYGPFGMVLSSFTSSTTFCLLGVALMVRTYGATFSLPLLVRIWKFGWPIIPGSLALVALQHSRSYVLNAYCTLADVGVWSLGYKFGVVITVALGQPLRNAWNAQMYSVWEGSDGPSAFRRVATVLCFVLLWAAFAVSALSSEAVALMAAPAYQAARIVVPGVAFGFAFRELADFFRNNLFVARRTAPIAVIEPALAVLDLALGVMLISRYGLRGAIAATPLSFGAYAFVMFLAARRALGVRYEVGRILLSLALAVAMTLVALNVNTHHTVTNVALKLALIALFPLLGVGLVFRSDEDRALLRSLRSRLAQ